MIKSHLEEIYNPNELIMIKLSESYRCLNIYREYKIGFESILELTKKLSSQYLCIPNPYSEIIRVLNMEIETQEIDIRDTLNDIKIDIIKLGTTEESLQAGPPIEKNTKRTHKFFHPDRRLGTYGSDIVVTYIWYSSLKRPEEYYINDELIIDVY